MLLLEYRAGTVTDPCRPGEYYREWRLWRGGKDRMTVPAFLPHSSRFVFTLWLGMCHSGQGYP